MTFSSPRKFFYMNGIFDRSWLPWIYQYVAPDARRRLGLPVGAAADKSGHPSPGISVLAASRELPWLPRKRRTISNGCPIRQKIPGGTGRNARTLLAGYRPRY